MSLINVYDGRELKPKHTEISSSYQESDRLHQTEFNARGPRSEEVIRPCYYMLHILGMWKPKRRHSFVWRVYRGFVFLVWLTSLAAIMCLSFVHYGFKKDRVHIRGIMNNVCTCMDFLCPFVFTLYYFNYGQFVEVVSSVQEVSIEWRQKLSRIARWHTIMSVLLWGLCAAFFMVHWFPFFSKPWHYAVYIPTVVFISGWWGTWLTIYGYVCHVHSLQIDIAIEEMKPRDRTSSTILRRHFQLRSSLERTQRDFNVIISLAIVYHTVDLIVFSFAYFNSSFGSDYPLWQYGGTALFDLTSLVFKLYPPALVAAAVHRIVVQASKRCEMKMTPLNTGLPQEDLQLFQYMALCEQDMGFKILGIRITVELAMKVLMTIVTAVVSFVVFLLRVE